MPLALYAYRYILLFHIWHPSLIAQIGYENEVAAMWKGTPHDVRDMLARRTELLKERLVAQQQQQQRALVDGGDDDDDDDDGHEDGVAPPVRRAQDAGSDVRQEKVHTSGDPAPTDSDDDDD